MSTYKLVYFNARGRAEVARLIFAQAGVDYEDVRLAGEEWGKKKPEVRTGQMPLLEVDGTQINGSRPISRFLAERFGLAGANDVENGTLAGIIDYLDDFYIRLFPYFYEKDEAKKAELKKKLEEVEVPKYMDTLEKIAASTDGDFINGGKVTYVDLSIFGGLSFITKVFPNILDGRPNLAKIKESVGKLPKIAEWLEKRPVTEY